MPWGAVAGGVIGAAGSIFGGSKGASDALKGYNYLTGKNGVTGEVANGNAANTAESQLLGTAPVSGQTQNGLNNYLNSTGYKFQQQQGTDAITGSAAARGLLNSGATAKALTAYGQGLAGSSFNNYLGQLNTQTQQGLTASGQIGAAGTQGGTAAGGMQQSGTTAGAGALGGLFSNGSISNLFSAI